MTEKQYETALLALGAKNVTTNRQKINGTTCFELPTGDTVAEFKSGYIRKYLTYKGRKLTCYQLNPVYQTPFKVVNQYGDLCEWTHNKRTLIMSRKARLKKLFLYTIKQINKENARA
tara:strand:+ start:1114 stop:1464 length:351 start_codon:yes stop_codon:yes gene_type:complete